MRLRARRFRDHLRDRADPDSAAPDPRRRRALGLGAGALDIAVELPASAIRLRADDGPRRLAGAGRIPRVHARVGAVSRGATAAASAGLAVSAIDASGAILGRPLAASVGADVG